MALSPRLGRHDLDALNQTSPRAASCRRDGFDNMTAAGLEVAGRRWQNAIDQVNRENLTFLEEDALQLHKELLRGIERLGVPGVVMETGVAKGGSALTLAALKRQSRCMHLYDTFEGMPPPSQRDGEDVHRRYAFIKAGKEDPGYYGYNKDLLGYVRRQFVEAGLPPDSYGVTFHKGLFNETLEVPWGVAYAHLDGDWYESTRTVMERVVPKLSVRGVMILDDIFGYSGAHDAFNTFFNISIDSVPEGGSLALQKAGLPARFRATRAARVYIERVA